MSKIENYVIDVIKKYINEKLKWRTQSHHG